MIQNYLVNNDRLLEVSNGSVTETYDLTKPLSENAIIVQEEKNNILHQMDLNSVIENLDNTVDLLDVSYHAVYGFSVQSQIFSLQKRVMDLNDNGIVVITEFKDKSGVIVNELISVFKWLTKGAEAVAIGKLEKFAAIAANMSKQASEMADGYESAASETSAVLQNVMDENAKQYEKSDNLRNMLAEIQAEQEVAAQTQESVSERLKTLKEEYERLRKAEDDELKLQHTQAIIGTVMNSLGRALDVVGNVASAVTGKQMSFTGSDSGNQTEGNGQKVAKRNSAADAALRKKLKTQREKLEQISKGLKELTAKQADAENRLKAKTDEKDAVTSAEASEQEKEEKTSALEKEIAACRDEIRELKSSINTRKKEEETAKKNLASLEEQAKEVNLDESAEDEEPQKDSSETASRGERMKAIFDEMIKLEQQKTEQLGLLAKYTKQMESVVIDQNATEAAIQSLIIAVSCLKRTVVALKDISLFWKSLESSCRALSDSSFKDTIKDLQSLDKAERIEFYYSEDVMYPLLNYMAQWSAIMFISNDYVKAAEKTRQHLNKTIVEADSVTMSRTAHWDQASELAGKVSGRIEQQVREGNKKIDDIKNRKNQL